MTQEIFDLIVIGAGVGGYVSAIRASQLGMKVLCIDKRDSLGGTCLNVGCIPSKALLHSSHKYVETQHHLAEHGVIIDGRVRVDLKAMFARKDKVVNDLTKGIAYLFKKNKVTFMQATAQFIDAQTIMAVKEDGTQTQVNASKIIIATGSESLKLPSIDIDEKRIVTSTGALSLKEVPKHLVVIGGGYIGLELGSVWQRLGAQVTVIEFAPSIVPALDHEVGQALFKSLKDQGLQFLTSTKVISVNQQNADLELTLKSATSTSDETQKLICDVVLACPGRRAFTSNLGLTNIGLTVDDRGCLTVDHNFETDVKGVFAIGDVIPGPMLAHKAEEEAMAVAEFLAGQHAHVNYRTIPSVIYTMPEVACVGQSEENLKAQQIDYRVGKFPFSANSRARPNAEIEGFVKILTHALTDEILGVHIIHKDAGTLIAEAVLAMEFRASSEDIARTCHAHPTLNEALKEAALNVSQRAIHI